MNYELLVNIAHVRTYFWPCSAYVVSAGPPHAQFFQKQSKQRQALCVGVHVGGREGESVCVCVCV